MMKRKTKRYDGGGVTEDDLEIANASEDPIQELNRIKGFTTSEDSNSPIPKKQSFKEAFAEARKGGDKTFEWEGKKYTTKLASENKPATKTVKTVVETTEPKASKPVEKYETPYDRKNRQNREAGIDFDSMVSKLKNRITGASDRGQDRIITGMRKNAGANMGMGNTGMKKGGKVSSASKRADGCCIRGKTRA
jgi:hypothetical protein